MAATSVARAAQIADVNSGSRTWRENGNERCSHGNHFLLLRNQTLVVLGQICSSSGR